VGGERWERVVAAARFLSLTEEEVGESTLAN
jgi:hypothetical protein